MKWYWYWMCAYFRFWYTVQNIWQSPKWMPARLIPSITCEDYTASNDINSFQTLKCGSYLNNLSSLRQYGRIARMDNSADAKISTASQLEEWKRPPGRSRVTLAKTFLDDVKSYRKWWWQYEDGVLLSVRTTCPITSHRCRWCCCWRCYHHSSLRRTAVQTLQDTQQ